MKELKIAENSNLVYELLKTQILRLELKPGERLSENTLASRFGIGRGQVRDAIAQLTEEGYIVALPKKGTFVTKISINKLRQSVYSHSVLEQAIIREICWSDDLEKLLTEVEDILGAIAKYDGSEDPIVLLVADAEARYLFASACHKEHIVDMYRMLDSDFNRVEYLQYSTFNYQVYMSSLKSWEHARVEGQLLINNLRQGDVEAACLICSNHYNSILWRADSLRGIYPQYFTE